MYRSKTLRNLPPQTRKMARLYNDLESVSLKIKHLIPVMAAFESDSKALFSMKSFINSEQAKKQAPLPLFEEPVK